MYYTLVLYAQVYAFKIIKNVCVWVAPSPPPPPLSLPLLLPSAILEPVSLFLFEYKSIHLTPTASLYERIKTQHQQHYSYNKRQSIHVHVLN